MIVSYRCRAKKRAGNFTGMTEMIRQVILPQKIFAFKVNTPD
jgi:hypothetical protein